MNKSHFLNFINKNKYNAYLEKQKFFFNDVSLFQQAITHKSFITDSSERTVNLYNETLEFIGDAILGFVISTYLFEKFPQEDEGYLSKYMSYLISKQSLFKIAEQLSLIDIVRVRGIQIKKGEFSSVLADMVEALIGAVYLDQGIDEARAFILTHFSPLIDLVDEKQHDKDYKSILQHITQKKFNIKPRYEVISEQGLAHNKIFSVKLYINDDEFGPCDSSSKKKAEQLVAELAYKSVFAEEQHKSFL